MVLLNAFRKKPASLVALRSGSFTVDRSGNILASTVPAEFPADIIATISSHVLEAFSQAAAAQLPLTHLEVIYPNFKITARELKGGAMIFLSQSKSANTNDYERQET